VVRQHPGRDNTHFYGALNLQTKEEIALRAPKMNAEVFALFLLKLLAAYPDQPILLLWDRAPWHRGKPIRQVLADHPRLQVLVFPTAAPDLNPQEHVWKEARSKVSHNHLETSLSVLADRFQTYYWRWMAWPATWVLFDGPFLPGSSYSPFCLPDGNPCAGMYIVGCAYNFCETHKSLRIRLTVGRRGFRWIPRTPVIAAGLTDHVWSMNEL